MKRMHFIILSCLLAQNAFSAVDGAKDDVAFCCRKLKNR